MTTTSPSNRSFVARYWRVGVVALLGGLLAFGASFVLDETYASSTRLLIRGRDATFLTTTGEDLTRQPGVIDASMAKTIAETQAGLATSREVATRVVDQLDLDAPKEEQSGPVAFAAKVVGGGYARAKAILVHGYYREPDPREAAIENTQAGIEAHQLGAGSGDAAGQPGSYILEIVGSGTSADQARDITNATADQLVALGGERFRAEAQRHADYLASRVDAAQQDVADSASAVGAFKAEKGITDLDEQLVLNATAADGLQANLRQAQVELAGAQAQLASLDGTLAAIDPSQQGVQEIQTGRSSTQIVTTSGNPVYNELLTQRSALTAQVADLQARQAALQSQAAAGLPTSLTADQVQLLQLNQRLTLAQDNLTALNRQHQDAVLNAGSDTAELTRIDTASTPTYPVAPKRYLYLALGLLIGGLAGAALTWWRVRHEQPVGDDDVIDLTDADLELELPATVPVGVGVGAGAGAAGAGLFDRPSGGNGGGNGHGAGGGAGSTSPTEGPDLP